MQKSKNIREVLYSKTKTQNARISFNNILEDIQIYSFDSAEKFKEFHDKLKNEEVNKINFTKSTDTMIVVNKAVILCHSFVLISQESNLMNLMNNFYDEEKDFVIIDFSNYSKNAIVLMLLYFYTGDIKSDDDVDIEELEAFNELINCNSLNKLLRKRNKNYDSDSESEDENEEKD